MNIDTHTRTLSIKNGELLETRTVLSGTAIVEPFSEVDYFGDSKDWSLNVINAPEVWAQNHTGADIVVAVVDTGVDTSHVDLVDSIWRNEAEIEGNGIDDDANGYVDDVFGWDFVEDDAIPNDGFGHGTHVAGVIAAQRNDLGSTGVAYDATIMPIRVLDSLGGGSQLDIASGIRYAVQNGANIINLSLGGIGTTRIAQALEYANQQGVLVVAASGNESLDNPDFPARYSSDMDNVISVGAFTKQKRLANFTNTVGDSHSVQVDAPGVGVYSTTAVGSTFRYSSGTSVAAPHVSGLAALALSANPDLTPGELRIMIADGADLDVSGSDSIGGINAALTVAYAVQEDPIPNQEEVTIPVTPTPAEPESPVIVEPEQEPVVTEPEPEPEPESEPEPVVPAPEPTTAVPETPETATPEPILKGDADANGMVNFADFLVVARNFGTDVEGLSKGDFDENGTVNFTDFLILARNFGETIEPDLKSLVMTSDAVEQAMEDESWLSVDLAVEVL